MSFLFITLGISTALNVILLNKHGYIQRFSNWIDRKETTLNNNNKSEK